MVQIQILYTSIGNPHLSYTISKPLLVKKGSLQHRLLKHINAESALLQDHATSEFRPANGSLEANTVYAPLDQNGQFYKGDEPELIKFIEAHER